MIRQEKKASIPMERASRHFNYASWVVSAVFYGVYIAGLISLLISNS
jgi:hypothetical protein